ncbi:MAG: RsmF rRNA methyltransferase first C-terminal domain-containing protein, partial [Clostridia bacterium]|nr:RsmF rRNA methyltransferase first C-terminal domain-containing protein [Clostridia bacterium]
MCEQSLPPAFLQRMRAMLGAQADAFFASYEQPPLRGVRFRDARRPLPAEELGAPIPYAVNACLLSSGSAAGALPLHEAGAYYLQEPSAMAAAAVLVPRDGDRVLDLCAAPGGKSTQLAQSAKLSLLAANEPIPSRAQILSRNIERMGITNAVVTCAYPDALAERWAGFFDKILVDAPCSGEGMFRRHPETRTEWTPDAPQRCHERQITILRSAARMLRPGGRMAYSTCTFNETENEGTVTAFLAEHPDFRLSPIRIPGLPEAPGGMLRLWPHLFPGEGHFVALLEKAGDAPAAATAPLPKPDRAAFAAWKAFCDETGCALSANAAWNGRLLHAPECLPPLDRLRVLRVGLHLGEVRGKLFLPD